MDEQRWYYAVDRQTHGPVSRDQLLQWIREGQLQSSDLVWCEGMPDWMAVSGVPELCVRSAPPPAPPANAPPPPAPPANMQYRGPGGPIDPYASAAFRPQQSRVRFLIVLLVLGLVLELLMTGLDVVGTLAFPDWNNPSADPSDGEFVLLMLLLLLLLAWFAAFVSQVVVFCMWAYRANVNARALGAQGMNHTPGWTVGWWFVPIMSLFKPYMAIAEIARASDPRHDAGNWSDASVPATFGLWWAAWLAMNIISSITTRMSFSADPSVVEAGVWIGVVEWLLTLAATLLVILVIREIESRQAAKAQQVGGAAFGAVM